VEREGGNFGRGAQSPSRREETRVRDCSSKTENPLWVVWKDNETERPSLSPLKEKEKGIEGGERRGFHLSSSEGERRRNKKTSGGSRYRTPREKVGRNQLPLEREGKKKGETSFIMEERTVASID